MAVFFAVSVERVSAIDVDAELVFLVDSGFATSGSEFSSVINGIADSFDSTSLVDAIEQGQLGSIAASVVLYGGETQQSVEVAPFQISDAASAAQFATLVRAVTDTIPTFLPGGGFAFPAIGAAIDFATNLITTDGLQVFAETVDLSDTNGNFTITGAEITASRQNLENSRDAAAAAGIDQIAIVAPNNTFGGTAVTADAEEYFGDSAALGQPEGESGVQIFDGLAGGTGDPQQAIQNTVENAVAVPEPSVSLLIAFLSLTVLKRNRKS